MNFGVLSLASLCSVSACGTGSAGSTGGSGSSGTSGGHAAGVSGVNAGGASGAGVGGMNVSGTNAGGANTGGAGSGGLGGATGGAASGGAAGLGASGSSASGAGGAETCIPGTGTTDIDAASVRDNQTCLTWQKTQTCMARWKDARQCCLDLTQSGFNDWRMPTLDELYTWVKGASVTGGNGTEYMTCPAFLAPGAQDPDNNFGYCAVTTYSAVACAHRGPANTQGTICVRGHGVGVPHYVSETKCSPGCGKADETVYSNCTD